MAENMNPSVSAAFAGGVLTISLNRPETGNAIQTEMAEALLARLILAAEDTKVGVVVLTGAGKHFCTGGDVGYMHDIDAGDGHHRLFQATGQVVNAIYTMPKPVIAMVRGVAAGAGLAFALSCDMIFCHENARFMTAFSKIGLASDGGAGYFLTRLVGRNLAKEFLMLSDGVSPNRLYALGAVNGIAKEGELETMVAAVAGRLINAPAFALSQIKRYVNVCETMDLNTALNYESAMQSACAASPDFREGTAAFLEKRAPCFNNGDTKSTS